MYLGTITCDKSNSASDSEADHRGHGGVSLCHVWGESGSHLFVGDRDESEFGQLSQDAQVGPHVQLAAHQHHLGTWAELLGLPLPLWRATEPRINTQ